MKTKLTYVFGLLTVTLCLPAFAQGTAFTYQGRLNTNNAPYSGPAEFQFTLWDAPGAGSAVATNNPASFIAPVDNGLFNVTLDFGISPFNGQPRFLQTEVRTVIGPFTTLTPRQPLTATPYALRALNLGTNGLAAGTYGNAVTFNNVGNSFAGSFAGQLTGTLTGAASGDGSGLTNVNAATLGGLNSSNFWRTDGNAGTVAGTHFLGTKDNLPLEIRVNNLRALRIEPSAANANVTMAGANNGISAGVSAGTVGGGSFNRIYSTDNSFIGSGSHNEIGTGAESSFSGTGCNFVGGGLANYVTTNCNFSFVGGGSQCFIRTNTDYGFVGGGLGCRLFQDCDYSAVVGGEGNNVQSSTMYAFVGGGFGNIIFSGGNYGTIGGGFDNFISAGALYASIPGGFSNRVSGNYSFAAGRRAKADNDGAFVWADSTDADFASTAANQFLIRASGGVGIGTASPTRELEIQHAGDTELGIKSTDTGGHLWTLQSSSVSGSANLDASFQIIDRTAGGSRFFIGTNGNVGVGTTSPQAKLHVAGSAVVQGLTTPTASAATNLLNLGSGATADGFRNGISFFEGGSAPAMNFGYDGFGGAGFNALRIYNGSDGAALCTFQQNGNVGIGTNTPAQKLHVIGNILASGTITGSSDRNVKENFAAVDARQVLAQVTSLPIQRWNYIGETTPHVGPMAQDFYGAFHVGMDDKHISMVDADGVALAAIQGLNEKLTHELAQKENEISELKTRLEKLERSLKPQFTKGN